MRKLGKIGNPIKASEPLEGSIAMTTYDFFVSPFPLNSVL